MMKTSNTLPIVYTTYSGVTEGGTRGAWAPPSKIY